MKFGDVLRELLEEQNLNQKQLADNLNISAGAVGNYVRNNREPDFETLKKIAQYFRVSIDYLLSYQIDESHDYRDYKILQIFHSLTEEQKEIYIEQGNLFIKSNNKKKEKSFSFMQDNKVI
ncbi:MAG: helix-turn-helix transcriptional regulator [Lachnospiraceae bacterium]|nr:helix-turn-helix transcriptional regulator [Lachnospiraceae bacterium]